MRIGLLICFAFVLAAASAEQIVLTNGTARCVVDTFGGRVLSCRVAVEVLFGGKLVSACEPERGYVDGSEPIPPNTLRLYKYRRGTCSEDM